MVGELSSLRQCKHFDSDMLEDPKVHWGFGSLLHSCSMELVRVLEGLHRQVAGSLERGISCPETLRVLRLIETVSTYVERKIDETTHESHLDQQKHCFARQQRHKTEAGQQAKVYFHW